MKYHISLRKKILITSKRVFLISIKTKLSLEKRTVVYPCDLRDKGFITLFILKES